MIISHSLKYVYLGVPRAASTAVSQFLVDHYEGERYGDDHNVVMPLECDDYYKFCTVRHPYTRARSLYFQARNRKKHRCNEFARNNSFSYFMEWMSRFWYTPEIFINTYDHRKNRSTGVIENIFYYESVNKRYGRDLNQVDYISYFFGINYILKMDYIIRIEEIEEEFCKLPFVNEKREIPVVNISHKEPDVDVEIDKKTEQFIYDWSMSDFTAFNYGRKKFYD